MALRLARGDDGALLDDGRRRFRFCDGIEDVRGEGGGGEEDEEVEGERGGDSAGGSKEEEEEEEEGERGRSRVRLEPFGGLERFDGGDRSFPEEAEDEEAEEEEEAAR